MSRVWRTVRACSHASTQSVRSVGVAYEKLIWPLGERILRSIRAGILRWFLIGKPLASSLASSVGLSEALGSGTLRWSVAFTSDSHVWGQARSVRHTYIHTAPLRYPPPACSSDPDNSQTQARVKRPMVSSLRPSRRHRRSAGPAQQGPSAGVPARVAAGRCMHVDVRGHEPLVGGVSWRRARPRLLRVARLPFIRSRWLGTIPVMGRWSAVSHGGAAKPLRYLTAWDWEPRP